MILSAVLLCALCVAPAHALEYTFDGADDYLFGRPTSDDTIYEWENPNVDRSKNTALIPPGFGTPTSYLPGSGEYLTPNLVPGALSGGITGTRWEPSEAGPMGKGGAREQTQFSPQAGTKWSGLCDDANQVGSVGSPNGGASVDASGNYPATDSSVSVDGPGFPTVSGDRPWASPR